MQEYKADLHIHTVLSPCADLDMTPVHIIQKAKAFGLQILGITDHNSTRNAKVIRDLGKKEGVFVLTGVEITTKEEVHCLAFFETDEQLDAFQEYLEENITQVLNKNHIFGHQPVVDEHENILEMVPNYLTAALKKSISSIQKQVYELGGIFIPAHVNRPLNGLFSHLGLIPEGLQFDAMGMTGKVSEATVREKYKLPDSISLVYNSDAHYLEQIGTAFSLFSMQEISFEAVGKALNQQENHLVRIP